MNEKMQSCYIITISFKDFPHLIKKIYLLHLKAQKPVTFHIKNKNDSIFKLPKYLEVIKMYKNEWKMLPY